MMDELTQVKVALMAMWEILSEDPMIDELPSRERRLLDQIETVVNEIYSGEVSVDLSLALDDFIEGGAD